MRISLSNLTIPSMDEKFGILIPRNLSSYIDSFSLSVADCGVTLISFSLYSPLVAIWNNMLVFAHHFTPPFYAKIWTIIDQA